MSAEGFLCEGSSNFHHARILSRACRHEESLQRTWARKAQKVRTGVKMRSRPAGATFSRASRASGIR